MKELQKRFLKEREIHFCMLIRIQKRILMSQKRELLGNDRRMEIKCPGGRAGLARNKDICLLLLF